MKVTFTVSSEKIIEFCEILCENGIRNEIIGADEGTVQIEVCYSIEDRKALLEMENLAEYER